MRRTTKTLSTPLLLLAAASLSGCASLSENECRTADWESIGYQDGSRGYELTRIGVHSEACAEFAIRVDRGLYEEGRARGLELFCTARNGIRMGRQGYGYAGVCPPALEEAFMRGHDRGRELHAVELHLDKLRTEIQHVQAELKREEPPLSKRDRDYFLHRLRELEREFGRSEATLQTLEAEAREF